MILTKVFDFFGFQKTYASMAEYLASPEAEKRLRDELARDAHDDFLEMRDRKPDEWADDVEADMIPAEMLDLVEAQTVTSSVSVEVLEETPLGLAFVPEKPAAPRSIIRPKGGPRL